MIHLDPKSLSTKERYKLLTGTIVPRPIAWVSTISSNGISNLAPFSYFNGVSSDPPVISISIARKPDGTKKDTLLNIETNQEFTVNFVSQKLAAQMNRTSDSLDYEISEFTLAGLTETPSTIVKAPRVSESLACFECKLMQLIEVGDGTAGSSTLVLGEIVHYQFDERIYIDGKINIAALDPVGRLAGQNFCKIGEIYTL